ncbi:MAG TPA: 30S ribosomal protein S4 [Candidatus Nanoarchaeia archaeon]|nr:30S ribosomal protein S4 [Candidatus Nanoarchaeia archaeon]
MGDPRKSRRKYKSPDHPWQLWRIKEEKVLERDYGLKNKREIWKIRSDLRRISTQVKKLIREKSKGNPQAELEEKQLLDRLNKLSLIAEGTSLADVLALDIKNLLNRRLQTIVFKMGLCLTAKQARQFILHGHIFVNGKKITIPSYYVNRSEESLITFNANSSLNSDQHPERVKKTQVREADKAKKKIENAEPDADIGISEAELDKIEKEVGRVEV